MEIRTRSPHTPFARRLIAAGAATLLAAAGLTVLAPPAAATEAGAPVSAGGVEPVHVPGAANRSCQWLSDNHADGDTWTEVKFEADQGEVATDAAKGDVALTSVVGKVVDWTSETPAVAVYVKSGSEGSNLYQYPTGSTGDEGLGTPSLSQAISHVSFCFGPLEEGDNPPPVPNCDTDPTLEGCQQEQDDACEEATTADLEGCEDDELTCEGCQDDPGCEIPVGVASAAAADLSCPDLPIDPCELASPAPGCDEGGDTEVDCDETPECEDEGGPITQPEETCVDNPDLDGCTQLGQPVTIVNPNPITVDDDVVAVDTDVVTDGVTLERPPTEVQAQITHRPQAAVASSTEVQPRVADARAPQLPRTDTRAPQLPRTGTEHQALALAGLTLVVLGAGLALSRRKATTIVA